MVKNLLSSAGSVGLIPDWGSKIPHATGQLKRCQPACCKDPARPKKKKFMFKKKKERNSSNLKKEIETNEEPQP